MTTRQSRRGSPALLCDGGGGRVGGGCCARRQHDSTRHCVEKLQQALEGHGALSGETRACLKAFEKRRRNG